MFKEIIYNADPYEIKCEKIRRIMDNENFINHILNPDAFMSDFVPYAIRALKYFNPEKVGPFNVGNECRVFILRSLNMLTLEKYITSELIEILNDVLEKDNLTNIMLALKIFASINRFPQFNEEALEVHSGILLFLVNSIFSKLESHNEIITENSFICLIDLFTYISDLNQNHVLMKKKIDLIIFRCVNFYISYLDERIVMDMINFKKNISLAVISSVSKLIKLISDTNVFVSRNENYSNTILELSKFAIFYCPLDATEIRKELVFFIFRIIIKSREVNVPKVEELYDLRFFYSPESHITNIKGLMGLTDILAIYFDIFSARTYFELIYRTSEILYSSLSFVNNYMGTKKDVNAENLDQLDTKGNFFLMEDKKFLVYENSLKFHLEIIKEAMICLNKQIYTINTSRLQRIEQIDLFHRSFLMCTRVIEVVEQLCKVLTCHKKILICKSIFISVSISFRELSDKLSDFVKMTPDLIIINAFKSENFFQLFDVSLDLLNALNFEENELTIIDDFFSIFFIPLEFILNDLIKEYSKKIVNFACKKIVFFEIIKKMSTETADQYSGFSRFISLLEDLLINDFVNKGNQDYFNTSYGNSSYDKLLFSDQILERGKDRYNFYNLYFTIVMNRYCSNSFSVNQKDVMIIMKCLDVLVKSDEEYLHEILLLSFRSLNSMKENTNIFQMYFYKNYKIYIALFFELYMTKRNIMYLDLIFSIPINLNLILADWEILIKPIIESLRSKSDVGIKALNYLLYLIDNTKKEIFSEKYESLLFELFKEVKNSLSTPKLAIYCAQILGRLKSFHKYYMYENIYFEDRSFIKGLINSKSKNIINQKSEKLHGSQDSRSIILQFSLDEIYLEILQFFRGRYKMSNDNRILGHNKPVIFKHTETPNLENNLQVEAAFDILSGFAYSILGWADFTEFDIVNKMLVWWGDLHNLVDSIPVTIPETNEDLFLSVINNSSLLYQVKKSQYIYDSIQALYACENTIVETKAITLLKGISQVVTSYWFVRRLELAKSQLRIYFNHLLVYRGFLEGFEFIDNKMPVVLLHDLLTRALKLSGSTENFMKMGILQFVFKQFVGFSSSYDVRKIRAGCNGICGLLIWDDIPMSWLRANLMEIITHIMEYIRHSQGNFNKIITTIEILFDILILNRLEDSALTIYPPFLNGLMSKNEFERIFSKKCLILFKRRFKEKDVLSVHNESVKSFLKDIVGKKDKHDIFIRIDVFIFILKVFPYFLSNNEIKGFVKMFFYFLKTYNFFSIPTAPFFQTDVSKIYSEEFLQSQKNILKGQDFIYQLYYKQEESKSYQQYLKYEITFLYLAYCTDKNNGKLAFDFIFSTLPKGSIVALKGFEKVNGKIIDDLLRVKYEECISEVLSVETIKKMICILQVLKDFNDERLIAFIDRIFLEFRNHREIAIFSQTEDNSILIKTFELSLMYPNQEMLYDKVILIVYCLLYDFSKSYTNKIESVFLKYIEKYSNLTYSLIVMNITKAPILFLANSMFNKVVSFRNYACNLGISSKKLGLSPSIVPGEDEITSFMKKLDLKNPLDLDKGINLLMFLKLIEFNVTSSQIQLALILFGELKKTNKCVEKLMEYFKYSINYFNGEDLEILFKIDPLFRIYNTVKVKTFAQIRNKSIMGCLLKSLSRNDLSSYENLIKFFAEHSWMLIEIFVEEKIHSLNMIEYCKNNLENPNICSYVLYYLTTFEPSPDYFEILLDLNYEERRFTLYCLKRIIDKFNQFEDAILKCLKSDVKYKSNVYILYPLLISKPELLSNSICKELMLVIYRLINTSSQVYFKLAAHLFKIVCDYHIRNANSSICEDSLFIDAFTHIVSFYINIGNSSECTEIFSGVFNKFDFAINFSILKLSAPNCNNLIKFLEMEIKKYNDNQGIKHEDYIQRLIHLVFSAMKDGWSNIQLSKEIVRFLDAHVIFKEDLDYDKVTLYNYIEYHISEKRSIENLEQVIFENFKNELDPKQFTPKFTLKDNRSHFFNREITNTKVEYNFDKIFNLLVQKVNISNILPFITKILKGYQNNNIDISESVISILISDISFNDIIPLFTIVFNKQKDGIFILKEKDLLKCALNFFVRNKNVNLSSLSSLSEIFYFGLKNEDLLIRRQYFQIFDEMVSRDFETRFYELLKLDWSLADESIIPYIFNRMLLSCLDDFTISSFRLFEAGIVNTSFFYDTECKKIDFKYSAEIFKNYAEKFLSNFSDFVQKYAPDNFRSKLLKYLYYSYDANISVLEALLLQINKPVNIDKIASDIFTLVTSVENNAKISLLFLKFLNKHKYFEINQNNQNLQKAIKYLRNGPECWAYLAELANSKMYKDMKMKDYYYGSIRVNAKFPEVSKASLLHQLGKIRDAQQVYEDIQNKAIESKVSFFEDEFDYILEEWIGCAKELQQWDLTLNIGKQKKDIMLIADSMFYTTNFNVQTEKENFFKFLEMNRQEDSNDPDYLFYELFIMLFDRFSTEKAISLIKEINKRILLGPNSTSYNNHYMIFLQIIFEMHEISFVFNNSLENNDKISSILFRWEDREPNFENDFLSLLQFSTWRKHAYRKIEDFSNELKFSELSVQEGDISGIVSKNKEYTETIKQLKKSMYFKGNNGLGKNSNYLGLVSFRKGYYDNALFSFKNVFDLPSIKVIDAYHKVIYELMCFYEMKEYKLGLDLANSTNVSHFLDNQSSNLFRIRGMFSEKLGLIEEAEKLYFQAIHLSNIGENYYHYVKLLVKNKIPNDEEIICAILLGLSCADIELSRDLLLIFLNFLNTKEINMDMTLYNNLLKDCNVNTFVFFIPNLIEFISSPNHKFIELILLKICNEYPQPVTQHMNLYLERHRENTEIRNRAYHIFKEMTAMPKVNSIISVLLKFTNILESVAFKNECALLQIVDSLILDIISLSYNPQELKEKFDAMFKSTAMRSQSHNIKPFIQALFYDKDDIILCPYKVLDILLLMKTKIFYLLTGTEDATKEKFRNIYNDFLLHSDIKKYIFGAYNQIRNDYKHVPYVELITAILGYCNIKYDKIEDLSFIGSDGKLYKYEYFKIKNKKHNLNFIYNLMSYKLSKNYELNMREAYLPLLKNDQLKEDVFINVIEYSYQDIDFIYEEYRIRNNLKHVISEYLEEIGINNHEHHINKSDDCKIDDCKWDNNKSDIDKSDIDKCDIDKCDIEKCDIEKCDIEKCDLIDINEINNDNNILDNDNIIDNRNNLVLNLDDSNYVDAIHTPKLINNINPEVIDQEYNICDYMSKISNKTKLRSFTNILNNNIKEDLLKNHFKSSFTSPYKYLLFKHEMISSYSTIYAVSYLFHTIHCNPMNIMVYSDKGSYINKKIFNTAYMNEDNNLKMYISPNIQCLFGREGIEGQFLSVIYHSCKGMEDYTEEIIKVFSKDKKDMIGKIKERIEKLSNTENIIKVINEWTDIENMSKIRLSEFAWL